ncbi:hypothetical protein ZHAS_00002730 [Anopheles sinensis]|uniref:Uncharacterized protein n=1 Tax=Anopheles sinensis TaxID=74873 RepID=A0A084VCW2_ANOSI|nr:hypothetical protein ZHAS_00002730 [Anopheles sinensis]
MLTATIAASTWTNVNRMRLSGMQMCLHARSLARCVPEGPVERVAPSPGFANGLSVYELCIAAPIAGLGDFGVVATGYTVPGRVYSG